MECLFPSEFAMRVTRLPKSPCVRVRPWSPWLWSGDWRSISYQCTWCDMLGERIIKTGEMGLILVAALGFGGPDLLPKCFADSHSNFLFKGKSLATSTLIATCYEPAGRQG